jgi:hypothetical protein
MAPKTLKLLVVVFVVVVVVVVVVKYIFLGETSASISG